jgi:ABC-type uncharacterized transport system fused permease/ATPase subunit
LEIAVEGLSPGVDVMITIFCDFRQFSAKKIGVLPKYQCYDQLFSKFSFVLSQKRQFFRKKFRRKYFKNHNIGPRSQSDIAEFTTTMLSVVVGQIVFFITEETFDVCIQSNIVVIFTTLGL